MRTYFGFRSKGIADGPTDPRKPVRTEKERERERERESGREKRKRRRKHREITRKRKEDFEVDLSGVGLPYS